ncbi:mitochondrial inner membrane protein OXA1L-like isoform 3-T3 [Pholidichthys leucotaenia]
MNLLFKVMLQHLSRIQVRVVEAAVQAEKPRFPSPQPPAPALQRGYQGVPGPAGRHSLSTESWVCPGVSSQWDVPETPQVGGVQDHQLQRSRLHTEFGCRSPAARSLLGHRHQGKLLWVNAVAVRYSSTQIPAEDGSSAVPSVVGVSDSPPVVEPPSVTQPITEQVPVENISTVVPVSADPTPVLTQPLMAADAAPTAVEVLQAVAAEPRLAELGLAGYTPVGLIQNLLEFIHMDLGLPWWGAIVAGTVLARLAVFPFIVEGQREAAKLNNVLPQINKLTAKMNEAKQSGNAYEFAEAYSDLNLFQKKHDVNPFRWFLIPLVQAPIFISFFIGLRQMAYLPVPTLQTGGVFWFTDLTAADPFYVLPLAVTGTMYFILELGAESGIDNANLRTMKNVFRIMPLIILPLTINFPTAVFTYWLTSNIFSLGQVALLRHPSIQKKLKIPSKVTHSPSDLPESDGFIKSIRKGWKNAQLAHQLEEREKRIQNHLDLAAKDPLRQTFTHNPLQQTPPIAATSAKCKPAAGKARLWKDTIE